MSDASSVRPEAALSIWRLTKEANSVLPLLRKLLKDGDLPWEAAEVLAEMGPAAEPAVPDLILALDEDETMQIYAAEALGKIGPGARSALPALQKLLDHKEEGVRKTAQRAIAAIEAK
jgi:HEAT repeat protein